MHGLSGAVKCAGCGKEERVRVVSTSESRDTSKRHFYLKWPWNVVAYVVLAVVLRIFAVPVILLMMWWNKKQQPDGPEEGYCLRRTRGRLTGLIFAALFAAGEYVKNEGRGKKTVVILPDTGDRYLSSGVFK